MDQMVNFWKPSLQLAQPDFEQAAAIEVNDADILHELAVWSLKICSTYEGILRMLGGTCGRTGTPKDPLNGSLMSLYIKGR
jgi:hypothetical protein